MSDNRYEYRIADFKWQLNMPQALTIKDETKVFFEMMENREDRDYPDSVNTVNFEKADYLNAVPVGAYFTDRCHYAAEGQDKIVFRCLASSDQPVAEVRYKPDGNILYKYLEEELPRIRSTAGLINALNLEYLMLARSAFLLHSCLVKYNGKAILFSAPSGTGKSTQGDLWVRHRGAEVLNGDRSGIYLKDDQWRATGLPFAGTSGIYRNENAPIETIVYLAQGPENRISRLSGAQAFRLLYPEISVHHWETDFVTKISDMLISLLKDIPVYFLSCTPDERAVETLEKQLLS